ncbi:MAG: type II toxin-antitoxin system RelE/ParE family toxin [bacterium]|nr:type II toxin-antitoxin system RelE/ParE family toxin [bacterium]
MEVQIDGPAQAFIFSLEDDAIAKVLRTIDLLERFGNKLGMPHSKKITSRIFELRIRGKQEVRLFYTFHQLRIIVLHGFVKKSRETPKREIENAQQRLNGLR